MNKFIESTVVTFVLGVWFVGVVTLTIGAYREGHQQYRSAHAAITAQHFPPIPTNVQPVTVTMGDVPDIYPAIVSDFAFVETSVAAGSAVVFKRYDKNGHVVLFAWTCAHVLTADKEVTANESSSLFLDPPAPPLAAKIIINGASYDTRLLKDSGDGPGQPDLALLQVIDGPTNTGSAIFSTETPKVGSTAYMVAAAAGEYRPPSFFIGIISANDRILDHSKFDQLECPAYPGCSGAGVFNAEGQCEGLMDCMLNASISFETPARDMVAWAQTNHVDWALDASVPLPTNF